MDQTIPSLALDDFLASLRNRTANGIMNVMLKGGELPVSVELQDSPFVVFSFTGAAVDRSSYPLPHFATHGLTHYLPASLIGFSDPSLTCHDRLRAAWYSGHEGFELQKILPDLLHNICSSLKVDRAAFIGGSSGGFAALYYSWHVPNSIAVVTNPQTNFKRYRPVPLSEYRHACWPSLSDAQSLSDVIDTDLCALYSKRFDNVAIILQVASDYFHVKEQFAPFIGTVPLAFSSEHLIVRMGNWGQQGHKSAPSNIWIPWVNAGLLAPEVTAASIEQTRSEHYPSSIPVLTRLDRAPSRDEMIAASLATNATASVTGAASSTGAKT